MSQEHCTEMWGTCAKVAENVFKKPAQRNDWGPPSATPHRCKGVPRHRSKLHVCAVCGAIGHRIKPLRFSKAGQQIEDLLRAVRAGKAVVEE